MPNLCQRSNRNWIFYAWRICDVINYALERVIWVKWV